MGPMTPLLLAMLSGENTPNVIGNFMGQFGSQQQPQFNAGARPHQFPEARFTEVKHV